MKKFTSRGKIEHLLIPLLVLAGVVFRFVQLPFSCVWLDEAFSIKLAGNPPIDIVKVICSDNGSPLFYFLLHVWMRLFGENEFVLTALTVLLDCFALIAVPVLLRELFSDLRVRATGTAAAAFCLPCLHQATNLRYYSLMVLCTVLSWIFFYRAVQRSRLRDGMLFVFFSVAGFYTHTFYLFVPLSQFFILSIFHRRRLKAGFVVLMFLAAAAAFWLPSLILQVSGYLSASTPETVPDLSRYTGGAVGAYFFSFSAHFLSVNAAELVRLTAAGTVWLFALFHIIRSRGRSADDRHARELFAAHLSSIGLIVLISTVRPIFWIDKMDLIGLPLVCGLAGYAVSKFRFPALALALLIAVNLAGASRYTLWRVTERLTEQRDVIKRLSGEITPGDAVVETGLSHFTANYYFDQLNVRTGPRYIFPEAQRDRPSCINAKQLLLDREALTAEASALAEKLKTCSGRIYVFYSAYEGLAPLYRQLEEAFVLERTIPVRQHAWGPTYKRVDVYRRR